MNIEEFRTYCLAKKNVTESFPFDVHTLVFKVANKMFAVGGLNNFPVRVNLKCDPERALELREAYSDIIPGFHMNKKHWNTVMIEGNLPNHLIVEMIDHSYELVVKGLPRNIRNSLL